MIIIQEVEITDTELCCMDALRLRCAPLGGFCGYGHYNNMSVEYEGMRLICGMSIDYPVMPGIVCQNKQRGGALITPDGQDEMTLKQIPLTEIQNVVK